MTNGFRTVWWVRLASRVRPFRALTRLLKNRSSSIPNHPRARAA
jgi:hypothetical protein